MSTQSDHMYCKFDSFCKKVLRNEAFDYHKIQSRRLKREVSFEYLTVKEQAQLMTRDRYSFDFNTFTVFDEEIIIENDMLAEALKKLPTKYQEVVLLTCLFDLNDREAGELSNIARRSVQRIRKKSLKKLHKLLLEVHNS